MRPLRVNQDKVTRRSIGMNGVGPQQARRLETLDVLEEHLAALEMVAGDIKMISKPALDKKGKVIIADGKPKVIQVPVLDVSGDPVYENVEMTDTEYLLYRIASSVVVMLRTEWDYGE